MCSHLIHKCKRAIATMERKTSLTNHHLKRRLTARIPQYDQSYKYYAKDSTTELIIERLKSSSSSVMHNGGARRMMWSWVGLHRIPWSRSRRHIFQALNAAKEAFSLHLNENKQNLQEKQWVFLLWNIFHCTFIHTGEYMLKYKETGCCSVLIPVSCQ